MPFRDIRLSAPCLPEKVAQQGVEAAA